MRKKKKSEVGWCVDTFLKNSGFECWTDAYRAGYRCVKIEVTEVER